MSKKIEVFPFNNNWSLEYLKEERRLRKILGNSVVTIDHIGSTSIQGLSAKPILDIVCVLASLSDSLSLKKHGYINKGEYNIPLRYMFSRDLNAKESGLQKVNLHVVAVGHYFRDINICFRDKLRSDHELRQEYSSLKKQLLENPESHNKEGKLNFRGYNLGKDAFIKKVLELSGYDDIYLNFCAHRREYDAYNRIKREHASKGNSFLGCLDDINNHFNFVLYKGTKIVAIASLERGSQKRVAIAVDGKHIEQEKIYDITISTINNWLIDNLPHVNEEDSIGAAKLQL